MRAGTHRDCNSDAIHAVLRAENDRCGLGPIQTYESGPKVAVFMYKITDEGWNP